MSTPYLAQSDIIRMEACLRHRASSYDLPATIDAKCSEKDVLELEKMASRFTTFSKMFVRCSHCLGWRE